MVKIKKFYVTTAIPYVNAAPHIGFALELIQTDVIARYNRILGNDVFFLTGTDENAQKNAITAEKLGIKTKELVDKNAKLFVDLTKTLSISNDDFIRTTELKHKKAAEKFWLACMEKKDIYKKTYTGLYCVGCEAFVTEKDLINGKCPEHLKEPEKVSEENYFFKLSKYQSKLEEIIKKDKLKIIPESRKNEILNFVKDGLSDFSISRPAERVKHWGIPVPNDEKQIIYVWFDALINYISALDYDKNGEKFKKYWPADVHVIGKGITRFHAIYWPAMLLSAGLPLPKSIFVHGYVTVNGQKISKSLGNAIDPVDVVKRFGVDQLRYFIVRDIPVFDDGDFNEEALIERVNNELVSKYSNLFYRITSFIKNNFDGKIPKGLNDEKIKQFFEKSVEKYKNLMEDYRLNEALMVALNLTDELNKYFQENKPWETIKSDRIKCSNIVYTSANMLKILATMFYPFIPDSSTKALKCLGLDVDWKNTEIDLKQGEKIEAVMLFKKINV
ncbi:MAG: methionine--tRNA ligase [Candidatus Aenigmarchaeota archaeon]|nr:methionine--tRNA ligase [Candidatus Aenigmarchaeota archaeon]